MHLWVPGSGAGSGQPGGAFFLDAAGRRTGTYGPHIAGAATGGFFGGGDTLGYNQDPTPAAGQLASIAGPYPSVTLSSFSCVVMARAIFSASTAFAGLMAMRGTTPNIITFGLANNPPHIGYTWNDDVNTYSWDSGLSVPTYIDDGSVMLWHLFGLVVEPDKATVYVDKQSAVHTYSHPPLTWGAASGLLTLGSDTFNLPARPLVAAYGMIGIWSRALMVDELDDLMVNPYRLLTNRPTARSIGSIPNTAIPPSVPATPAPAIEQLRRNWRRQPAASAQINWGHPLADKLRALIIGCEGGAAQERVFGQHATPAPTPTRVSPGRGVADGIGILGDAYWPSGIQSRYDVAARKFTVACFVYIHSAPGTDYMNFMEHLEYTDESHNAGWQLGWRPAADTSPGFSFSVFNNNAEALYALSWNVLTPSAGDVWFVAGTTDGTTRRLFAVKTAGAPGIAEVANTTNSPVGGTMAWTGNGIDLGHRTLGLSIPNHYAVLAAYLWRDRALTLEDLQQLYTDPYCMMRPPGPILPAALAIRNEGITYPAQAPAPAGLWRPAQTPSRSRPVSVATVRGDRSVAQGLKMALIGTEDGGLRDALTGRLVSWYAGVKYARPTAVGMGPGTNHSRPFFRDTFDRANSTLTGQNAETGQGPWTDLAGAVDWSISGGSATPNNAADGNHLGIDIGVSDLVTVWANLFATDSGMYGGIEARMTSDADEYHFELDRPNNRYTLYRRVSGTYLLLDQLSAGGLDRSHLLLRVEGSNIKGYANGVQVCSAVDSAVPAGTLIGMRQGSAGTTPILVGEITANALSGSIPLDLSATAQCSVTIFMAVDSFAANMVSIAAEFTNNFNNNAGSWGIFPGGLGDNTVQFGMGASGDRDWSIPSPSVRALHAYTFLMDRATPANSQAWIDSIQQTLTPDQTNTMTGNFANDTLYLFARGLQGTNLGPGNHLSGAIPIVIIHNRLLQPAEIQQLYADPYSVLAGRSRRLYTPAGVTAPTFEV